MADAIDREQMRRKVIQMQNRIKQRRDGGYKCGYNDACKDALQKLDEIPAMETKAVTLCKYCQSATERTSTMPYCMIHNKRKAPDDWCNFGTPDYE